MTKIPADLRIKDVFHHIDMGFLNRRLCITALPPEYRAEFIAHEKPGDDRMTVLSNDHLLVTMLLDACDVIGVPPLLQAMAKSEPKLLFRSTERLAPCPEIYEADRVEHEVQLDIDFGKPINIAYHTSHLVSDTGKMTLSLGSKDGYVVSIIGLLHDRGDSFEIEPLVIGAPWFDHPRNGSDSSQLMFMGQSFGEIHPEDIGEFSKMSEVKAEVPTNG